MATGSCWRYPLTLAETVQFHRWRMLMLDAIAAHPALLMGMDEATRRLADVLAAVSTQRTWENPHDPRPREQISRTMFAWDGSRFIESESTQPAGEP